MALSLGKEEIPKPSPSITTPKNPSPPLSNLLLITLKHTTKPYCSLSAIEPPSFTPMPKPALGPRDHTNPLIWCFAIIFAVLAVAIIISGAVVFIGYMVVKPKVPVISVTRAQLNNIYFDQVSLLTVQVTVVLRADNGNTKARASFYDTRFALSFRDETIAYLVAQPFELSANRSVEFNYVTQSTSIPLNPDEAEDVGLALRGALRGREISFELKGRTRSRWRVWLIGSLKSWLNLNCQLRLPVDGTRVYPRCSSKSH